MSTISTGEPPTCTTKPKSSCGLEDSGKAPSDFEDSCKLDDICGKNMSEFEDSGRVPSDCDEDSLNIASRDRVGGNLNLEDNVNPSDRGMSKVGDSLNIPNECLNARSKAGDSLNVQTKSLDTVGDSLNQPNESADTRSKVGDSLDTVFGPVGDTLNLPDRGMDIRTTDAGGRTRTMQQEPDSGYEASPCSVTDDHRGPDSHRFFGDDEEDVFEDDDCFVFAGSDEDNSCLECAGRPHCECPESSSAAETVLDDCDNSSGDDRLPSSSASMPVRIPVEASSSRTRTRPFPFTFHPRSCPSAWLEHYHQPSSELSLEERLRRRASLQNQRRRRMLIDSDASSDVGSSDDNFLSDDGLDGVVFPMPGDAASAAVVEDDSPPTSTSTSSGRRGRSTSINLPPEPEVLQSIGRSLRRFSDEFQIRREQAGHARRRQTITGIDRFYRAS